MRYRNFLWARMYLRRKIMIEKSTILDRVLAIDEYWERFGRKVRVNK